MTADRIEALIVDFVRAELLDADDEVTAIDVDENLFTSGLVDSVGIMRLIAHLQRELGVDVPPRDLTPDNFRTIRVMTDYLGRLAGG